MAHDFILKKILSLNNIEFFFNLYSIKKKNVILNINIAVLYSNFLINITWHIDMLFTVL